MTICRNIILHTSIYQAKTTNMFLLITIVCILLVGLSIENRENREFTFTWPVVWLVVWGAVSWIFARSDFYALFSGLNLIRTLIYAGGWILIGLFWSFFKWKQLARYQYQKFLEYTKRGDSHIDIENNKRLFRPEVAHYVGRISGWISLWPFSFLSFLFGDAWDRLVLWFEATYNKITDSQFK